MTARTAIAKAHRLLAELQAEMDRTSAALVSLQRLDCEREEQALNDARTALQDMRAAFALGDATEQDLATAEQGVSDAEAAHRAAHSQAGQVAATAAGLNRHLQRLQEQRQTADVMLHTAKIAWCKAEFAAADAEYVKHGLAAAAAAARAKTIGQYLQRQGQPACFGMWPSKRDVVMQPIDSTSLEAAKLAYPHRGTSDLINSNIFREVDPSAAMSAFEQELEALCSEIEPEAASASPSPQLVATRSARAIGHKAAA